MIHRSSLLAAFVTALLGLTTSALAATPVPLAHFHQVSLRGGGHVVLRHGSVQTVTLIKGSAQFTELSVRGDGELVISACNSRCPHSYDLEIEIVSPVIDGVAIHGGGEIEAQGTFPKQKSLGAAIHGGGEIDVRAMPAQNASAAVNGGGAIKLAAENSLSAAIHGGGEITYWGNPAVTSAVAGGGDITKGTN